MNTSTNNARVSGRLLWLAGLAGLAAASQASAISICVSNLAQLEGALTLGTLQSSAYTIQIAQGTYLLDTNSITSFSAPTTIEGGYNANCTTRTVNAGNTVINGQNHVLQMYQPVASPQAQLNIDGLTISNAVGFSLSAGSYGTFSNDEGSLRVSRTRLTQLSVGNGDSGPAIELTAYNGLMVIENVQIDNVSTTGSAVVSLFSEGGAPVLVNHLTARMPAGKDFELMDDDSATSFSVHNSILWSLSGTTEFTGVLSSSSTVLLVNDVFPNHFITGANVIVQNQLNTAPGWIDAANNNYHLQTNPLSPAINSGTLFSPGGEPATDIEGKARIVGSAPDRGAYESLVTDQTTFIVSNTLDSGAGSLRDAITLANASLSPPKLIKFDIRNQVNVPICPAVISLSTVLPTIVGRMTIDGSTQPGSTVNTAPTSFNANLCVVIKPASGTLASGFTVPPNSSGSLSLRGLAIGGFGQPIRILGGEGSLIAGNQLGGNVGAIALPGAGLSAITIGSDASGELSVGGTALADRNVIGDAASSGIDNQSDATTSSTTCQIVNNLVGLAPDGHTQLANAFGINNSGSGCQIVGNRIAGNTIDNLWLNGSTSNVVQQNIIGVTNQNAGFLNNATGILVTGPGNIIGASGSGGSVVANTVRFMGAGGIVVKGTTALGNRINANLVYENGLAANGMDIDQWPTNGVSGPTSNDPGDGDEGPNHLQNFPVLNSLAYTAAGSINRPGIITGVLDTQSGAHRVDIYFSSAANPLGKRGHAEVYLAQATVNVGNGRTTFSIPISVPNQNAGGVISATATDAAGNTSEISIALSTDTIFKDGID